MAKVEEAYQKRTVDNNEKAPGERYAPSQDYGTPPAPAPYQDYGMPPATYSSQEALERQPDNDSIDSSDIVPLGKQKRVMDAYILGIGLGFFGGHHFYLKRYGFGVAYFFTLGFLGCGWLVDMFRMPLLVRRYNRTTAKGKKDNLKHLDDAYVCWFPLGLFGCHHFYLGRTGWGLLYLFTLGLLGVGWLIDLFYLPYNVKKVNKVLAEKPAGTVQQEKSRYVAWTLAVFPVTGLLGVHHYYLGNYINGIFYTFTLGNVGIGYLTDWFRTPLLVRRALHRDRYGYNQAALLDVAYLYAFPLGLLGLHRFYLRSPGWGVLYFFTLGCFGIGWIIDLIRMPCLVNDCNKILAENASRTILPHPEASENPAALEDPCEQQQKALDGSSSEGAVGGVFATDVQHVYPHPGYPGYNAAYPAYNDQQAYPGYPAMYGAVVTPYSPPGEEYPPQYRDQDGLPSYTEAVSVSTIESSLVSSQGGPPSLPQTIPPKGS